MVTRRIHRIRTQIGNPFFLFATCCLLPSASFAQISFERTYGGNRGDQGYSVQQTSDGGYIIAGHSESFDVSIYLIKTDSLGDTLWTRTFGDTLYDVANSVKQTSDGGYIVVGSTKTSGPQDVYVIKTNSMGDPIWIKNYGGPMGDAGSSVQETQDGGFIIVGGTDSYGEGGADVYLIKTDAFGDSLWTKTYGDTSSNAGISIQKTPSGGYIIGGFSQSSGGMDMDFYLINTDSAGDTLWSKKYGGIWDEYGMSVEQTMDEGFVIVGSTQSFGAGNFDVYLVRTDSSGDTLWTKTYGGTGSEEGRSIQRTSDGGYIISGTKEFWGDFDVYLVKIDSLGDTLWTRTFGDTFGDWGMSSQETSDGGYVIVGYSESFGAGGEDVYLIKTAGDGSVGIKEESSRSKIQKIKVILFHNQPNPFHHSTVIRYQISSIEREKNIENDVTLRIYDLNGRLVETLVDERQEPGIYQIQWDGKTSVSPVPTGVYFYRLQSGDFTDTKKLILLR